MADNRIEDRDNHFRLQLTVPRQRQERTGRKFNGLITPRFTPKLVNRPINDISANRCLPVVMVG